MQFKPVLFKGQLYTFHKLSGQISLKSQCLGWGDYFRLKKTKRYNNQM